MVEIKNYDHRIDDTTECKVHLISLAEASRYADLLGAKVVIHYLGHWDSGQVCTKEMVFRDCKNDYMVCINFDYIDTKHNEETRYKVVVFDKMNMAVRTYNDVLQFGLLAAIDDAARKELR